ncbi:MAG: NHL domain-containing protein [Myxococcaceae bacterium]
MRSLAILAFLLLSACSVRINDAAGLACDEDHPCAGGRICHEGACVDPATVPAADGGANDAGTGDAGADDAGADDAGTGDGGAGDAGNCAGNPVIGTACAAGVGECRANGTWVCQSGAAICNAVAGTAQAELCDGKDNDCNGTTDDGLTVPPCALTQGVCSAAPPRTCQGAAGWSACTYGADYQTPETRCDGKDNDCDGDVDDVSGCLYTLAGGGPAGLVNGPASSVQFAFPGFLTADSAGNLYVADTSNHVIRKVDPQGAASTVAGSGECGYLDGPVATARMCAPADVVVTSSGVLYFSDRFNQRIRKIENGTVSTLAGNGFTGYTNGAALSARFNDPRGLELEPNGDLLIADTYNQRIRRYVVATQMVETYAGTGTTGNTNGATPLTTQFNNPLDVARDSAGNVYVSELSGDRIRKFTPAGAASILAGSPTGGDGSTDGIGTLALFSDPYQMAVDEVLGYIYVADRNNERIRAVPLSGTTTTRTPAGSGNNGFLNGTASRFEQPIGIAIFGTAAYVTDANHVIRKVTWDGVAATATVTDFAGVREQERSRDGTGTGARLCFPLRFSKDTAGNLYFAEDETNIVRRMTAAGVVTTIAGDATAFTAGGVTGPLSTSRLDDPQDVQPGPDGKLYVADQDNSRVRVIDLGAGTLSTFAGTSSGYLEGALLTARFRAPTVVTFGKDTSNNDVLFVGDLYNYVIRAIPFPLGPVALHAGTAQSWGTSDGAPGTGHFPEINDVVAAPGGVLYVADSSGIRKVDSAGVISTLYGSPPVQIRGLALDGTDLVGVGQGSVYRFSTTSASTTLVFDSLQGWHDGLQATAGVGSFTDVIAEPNYYLLVDYGSRRIRRLWK